MSGTLIGPALGEYILQIASKFSDKAKVLLLEVSSLRFVLGGTYSGYRLL